VKLFGPDKGLINHYNFRVNLQHFKKTKKKLELIRYPRMPEEQAWRVEYYKVANKTHDRELFP
jgi:hypothetical protein